jgi:hypothetical protein
VGSAAEGRFSRGPHPPKRNLRKLGQRARGASCGQQEVGSPYPPGLSISAPRPRRNRGVCIPATTYDSDRPAGGGSSRSRPLKKRPVFRRHARGLPRTRFMGDRGKFPKNRVGFCGHARGGNTRGFYTDECQRCRPPSGQRLASTIARMPARTAAGRLDHASTT